MSLTTEQLRVVEDAWADFDVALAEEKFAECRTISDNLGELGYEMDALRMHKMINSKEEEVGHREYLEDLEVDRSRDN